MYKVFLFALLMVGTLCGHVFADGGAYEFSWRMGNLNYEALIVIPDDSSTAYGKVRMTYDNGELDGFVEEKFRIETDDDGLLLLGYGLPDDAEYSPDNFLILRSGKAFVVDDAKRTSPIHIRVVSKSEFERMLRKYRLRNQ